MNGIVSWSGHEFHVVEHDANWNDVAGVYIFSGLNSQNRWVAIYIGQTDSFRNRIPQHDQWTPAARLGATHVHAMTVPQATERDRIERLLIATYQPVLNTQLKKSYSS